MFYQKLIAEELSYMLFQVRQCEPTDAALICDPLAKMMMPQYGYGVRNQSQPTQNLISTSFGTHGLLVELSSVKMDNICG